MVVYVKLDGVVKMEWFYFIFVDSFVVLVFWVFRKWIRELSDGYCVYWVDFNNVIGDVLCNV